MDRNLEYAHAIDADGVSLSARRAWIEMVKYRKSCPASVSLSARRAWIEMLWLECRSLQIAWSLSARRAWIEIAVDSASGTLSDSRSPQGERG